MLRISQNIDINQYLFAEFFLNLFISVINNLRFSINIDLHRFFLFIPKTFATAW